MWLLVVVAAALAVVVAVVAFFLIGPVATASAVVFGLGAGLMIRARGRRHGGAGPPHVEPEMPEAPGHPGRGWMLVVLLVCVGIVVVAVGGLVLLSAGDGDGDAAGAFDTFIEVLPVDHDVAVTLDELDERWDLLSVITIERSFLDDLTLDPATGELRLAAFTDPEPSEDERTAKLIAVDERLRAQGWQPAERAPGRVQYTLDRDSRAALPPGGLHGLEERKASNTISLAVPTVDLVRLVPTGASTLTMTADCHALLSTRPDGETGDCDEGVQRTTMQLGTDGRLGTTTIEATVVSTPFRSSQGIAVLSSTPTALVWVLLAAIVGAIAAAGKDWIKDRAKQLLDRRGTTGSSGPASPRTAGAA